jgi:hypothetical protein
MTTYEDIQDEMEEMLEPSDEMQFTFSSLMGLKKTELVDLCREYELASSGNKDELALRILEHLGEASVVEAKSTLTFTSEDKGKEEEVVGKAERI